MHVGPRTKQNDAEAIANSPEYYFDMELVPGDLQLVSNHSVIHARTAYRDAGDADRRRHLLRLWLSLEASDDSAGDRVPE